MKAEVFREYDIRGIVATDFPAHDIVTLGRAFATYARSKGAKNVVVGQDCRETSPSLAASFIEGARAGGLDVIDVSIVATPMNYFASFEYKADASVQITGSHNPIEYNGFKMTLFRAALFGTEIRALHTLMEAGDFASGAGSYEKRDITPAYLAYLERDIKLAKPLNVVLDAGNGVAGPFAVEAFTRIGCKVTPLYCDMDGTFPNHHPDPTVEKNLKDLIATVKAQQADIGIAFDGDGDRIGVVDGRGRIIWGDMILLYLGAALAKEVQGVKMVADVKCSKVLFEGLRARGVDIEMFKTGHSLIKARMKETGAQLAGEMSGHIFYGHRFFGFDDATYTACRFVEILAASGEKLSAFFDRLPKMAATPEIRLEVPEALKWELVKKAQDFFAAEGNDVNTIDGVRVTFKDGWGLLRASNTQPVIVLRFEAEGEARLHEIEKLFMGKLAEWGAGDAKAASH